MTGIDGFIQRTLEPERAEDQRIIDEGDEVEEGAVKQVFEGLHGEMIMPIQSDEEIRQIYRDLHGKARVVNTWAVTEEGVDMFKQDRVPDKFYDVMYQEGLEHVIRETVEVFESFADHGYAYCDLSPDNIRFHNGNGIAIDYLDEHAVEKLDGNPTFAAAKSYDLFTSEITSDIPGLQPEEVERYIDKYSNHVSTEKYTGDVLADFAFKPE
ncbi:hypothetical protein [Candidatus Nanohalovita haloferacivicina]|uniref:hypothetical protein n=1 Tax=Candidatus Nanohalovita haloferacivicina TaxID=2978046 RepID=UPI00325FC2B8|nr:hypothetical protein HBNXNv_0471 [Candidatus Nanohalobia archaeon BNXNv]